MLDASQENIAKGFDISVSSLAHILRYLREAKVEWNDVKSILTLTFESQRVFPSYGWMHIFKAGLEGLVRGLAWELGTEGYRVNAISAGPMETASAKAIPGFNAIAEPWDARAPLGWDMSNALNQVALQAAHLLDNPGMMTGQVFYVDGGFHLTAMDPPAPVASE